MEEKMSDHELDKLEIDLMVNIEDKNVTKKELVMTCKRSLYTIKSLRKELEFYTEEYYLPDDAPDYFKKEHLTEKECKNAKFDVIHHTVGDGIVTLHHYLYRSRIMAFRKYVMLMSKYVDDFVEMNRYNAYKVASEEEIREANIIIDDLAKKSLEGDAEADRKFQSKDLPMNALKQAKENLKKGK